MYTVVDALRAGARRMAVRGRVSSGLCWEATVAFEETEHQYAGWVYDAVSPYVEDFTGRIGYAYGCGRYLQARILASYLIALHIEEEEVRARFEGQMLEFFDHLLTFSDEDVLDHSTWYSADRSVHFGCLARGLTLNSEQLEEVYVERVALAAARMEVE